MMAKSNRKTMHFAHEISDILAVQKKNKCGLGMRLNLYNAMHSETGMKAHKLL